MVPFGSLPQTPATSCSILPSPWGECHEYRPRTSASVLGLGEDGGHNTLGLQDGEGSPVHMGCIECECINRKCKLINHEFGFINYEYKFQKHLP